MENGSNGSRRTSGRWRGRVLVVSFLAAMACGRLADLPPGWELARPIAVTSAQCTSGPGSGDPHLQLSPRDSGAVDVKFDTTTLRCGQAACGYVLEEPATTKVLV